MNHRADLQRSADLERSADSQRSADLERSADFQRSALFQRSADFQRFAHRRATQLEERLLADLQAAEPASARWVFGLRPEALAFLSVSYAESGKRVLFISHDSPQLEERKLRFAKRAEVQLLDPKSRQVRPAQTAHFTLYCGLDALLPQRIARVFGAAGPDLIVVEDAHLLSPTSQDFRARGAAVAKVLALFPAAALLLEAPYLTPSERDECARRLGVTGEAQLYAEELGSLRLAVHEKETEPQARREQVLELAETLPRPAVFYAQSPSEVDEIYSLLDSAQIPVHRLHAAMTPSERARELLHFSLPGRRAVLVSMVPSLSKRGGSGASLDAVPELFGRGYRRADILSLVHLQAPSCLSQYARELTLLSANSLAASELGSAGATGADLSSLSAETERGAAERGAAERGTAERGTAGSDEGEEALDEDEAWEPEERGGKLPHAIILGSAQDLIFSHGLLSERGPAPELVEHLLSELEAGHLNPASGGLAELSQALGVSSKRVEAILRVLEEADVVAPRSPGHAGASQLNPAAGRLNPAAGRLNPAAGKLNPAAAGGLGLSGGAEQAGALLEQLRLHEASHAQRLARVEEYFQSAGCRKQALLESFGIAQSACGSCDFCDSDARVSEAPKRQVRLKAARKERAKPLPAAV